MRGGYADSRYRIVLLSTHTAPGGEKDECIGDHLEANNGVCGIQGYWGATVHVVRWLGWNWPAKEV